MTTFPTGENTMKALTVIFALVAFAVAGCATLYQPTPYQPVNSDGGFSSTQLGENIFEVHFWGNEYTSSERASDFALLRSAELTLEGGFEYFIIDGDENTQQTDVYTTPTRSKTELTYWGWETEYSGGRTYTTSRPHARKVVVCFKEKPDWSGLIYEAQFVVQSLNGKYEATDEDSGL